MRRSKKRAVCLLLAAVMLLGLLAGCGKKDNTQQLTTMRVAVRTRRCFAEWLT